jgi:hypothetical protein
VVENKEGAGGIIGTQIVAKSRRTVHDCLVSIR